MDNPICTLLKVSLENLREIGDANTVIGKAIDYSGMTIIPVSKVKVTFLSGGSEIKTNNDKSGYPFGGGSGGNVSVTPVAFLVCCSGDVRVLHVTDEPSIVERIADKVPEFIDKLKDTITKKQESNN